MTRTPDAAPAGSAGEAHKRLMDRVALGRDREAFRALFLHFGPRVKAMMLKAGATRAEAEDIVQDVMMTMWRKSGLYARDRGAVSTWVFTIARNARIDRLRRGSSRPYEDIDGLDLAATGADAEAGTISAQEALRVSEALAELPGEQRRIVELAYIHDMPHSRIARKLAVPLGTVKSRMRLACAKLRARLEDIE